MRNRLQKNPKSTKKFAEGKNQVYLSESGVPLGALEF